jgi:hypothetical protein
MTVFNGFLYAGTINPKMGFQIWKTRAEGYPYQWEKVITAGAFRGNSNEAVVSMCVFHDALYVGTGLQGIGFEKTYDEGPAAAELIRIHPNDSWELIVGNPRRTFEGVKIPLSGMGPGFDNGYNTVIWRMAEHDGWLYVGTEDVSVFLLSWLCATRGARLWGKAIDDFIGERGGFDLWRSQDGTAWEQVTGVGFGNPRSHGVRTFASTPAGLFVGTATARGCEIWLGSRPEQRANYAAFSTET